MPRPVRDVLRKAYARWAGRTALVSTDGSVSFDELGVRARRLATALDEEGINPTEIVGFLVSSRAEALYEVRLATCEHGAAVFGIPPMLPDDALAAMLRGVRPRLVLYDPKFTPDGPERVARAMPDCGVLALGGGEPTGRLARVTPRESLNVIEPTSLAALGFTSGTTGRPKGVMGTHGAVAASVELLLKLPGVFGAEELRAAFNGIPLFAAGSGMVIPALASGMTMHVPEQWDVVAAADLFERERVEFAFLTPSMLIDLLDLPDLERRDFSSLKTLVYGSAITPVPRIEEAVRRLGPVLLQGYGMAECLPPVSVLSPAEHGTREAPAPREVLSSAGRLVPGVQARIDTEVGFGSDVGEILIQSPTVTAGYWNDPERTAASKRDGWFRTGDIGRFDSSGRLHVLDRRADMISRGGRTIFPRVIEEVLSEHASVKEVHAVQLSGAEEVVAAVSLRATHRGLKSASALEGELLSFAGGRLAPADRPDRIVVFPGDLPRSVQGKVLKREIRDALGRHA